MERIILFLKVIYRFIYRFKLLPPKFWFNNNVGYNTYIDRRYISIKGYKYIHIGNGSKILAGLRLEAISKYCNVPYFPNIKIGDSVCINQNFHCICASFIEIGDGTSITANCGIFDIEHPYEDINTNPRLQNIQTKPIRIWENCLIGMNSVILPGVTLGNHTVVGANSIVREGQYPHYCVLAGVPARIVKRYDFNNRTWGKTDIEGNFLE